MRLLLINPNISESVTALIEAEARRSARPGTALTAVTASFGVAYIETRFEALIGAHAVAELAGSHAAGHDAVVIAAFGDPGLMALREVLPMPVVGLTEAALMSACQLGRRFSIIAISQRIGAWYRECVESYGLGSRLASIRSLNQPLRDVGAIQQAHRDALVGLAQKAVREDGADVIVLAGAPLAGLARQVKALLPVPMVDGVSSAVVQAQALVALNPSRAVEGSFATPPVKPHAGLSPALAALLQADGIQPR
jgi:Asp/Glu/hydantoin racemase